MLIARQFIANYFIEVVIYISVKLIGIDIGTQGASGLVINAEGEILAESYQGYNINQPQTNWAQKWPEDWVEATYKVLNELLDHKKVSRKEIEGLAISSLYGGSGIPVDSEIKPTAPCLIWLDRRAEKQVNWVKEHLDLERLYNITGNYVDSYHGFTKMMWIRDNWPEVWEETELFLPPNSYIIYQLTKELAIDYSSAGNIGGIFDLKKRKWSEEMSNKLDLPLQKQPQRLVKSTEIVGEITAEAAAKTGLKAGVPVVAGGVDAPVATLSAGAIEKGSHVAMMGTSMCWGMVTEESHLSNRLVSMPNVIEPQNKVYSFGGAATAGAIIRWFRDVLGRQEMKAGQEIDINAYKLLELKAEDIPPGAEGLLVLPYFMGERSPIWDSKARGTVLGLSLYHKKEHLFQAFMEGVAYALRHNMEILDSSEIELDKELVMVGGATKSSLWPQILADVTGYPVKLLKSRAEAPLGDALLAGLGTGVFSEIKELKNWLAYEKAKYPVEKNKELYDKYYAEYKELYPSLKKHLHRMSEF